MSTFFSNEENLKEIMSKTRDFHNTMIDPKLHDFNKRIMSLESHITHCPHNPEYYQEEFAKMVQNQIDSLKGVIKHVQEFEVSVFTEIQKIKQKLGMN